MTPDPVPKLRTDIQALRGYAVSLVLIFHAKIGLAPGGFLGVDIFFVVSGFLITRIVSRELEAGTFRFSYFYFRRARRLIPAAYTVLALTTIGAIFTLSSTQFGEYVEQLYGSIFFAANIVLWAQTGYFAESAYLKPLLHMWSLAIEEQYYLLMPLMLLIIPRRFWLAALCLAVPGSFALGVFLTLSKPSVAFFFLPTRAWELGIGSAGALLAAFARVRAISRQLLLAALMILLWIPFFPTELLHPGLDALLVCLATLTVILAGSRAVNTNPVSASMAKIGDMSYSLYLVHFPLFALCRAAYMSTDLPPALTVGILTLSLAGGYILYRFVEVPTRRAAFSPKQFVGVLLGGTAALAALPELLPSAQGSANLTEMLRPNAGLGCQEIGAAVRYDRECAESNRPSIIIWGDSLAGHLIPAVTATTDQPVAQASAGMCGPILGVAARIGLHETNLARHCLAINWSVVDYFREAETIEVVAITGSFARYFPKGADLLKGTADAYSTEPTDMAVLERRFLDTVRRVRGLGKRVIIVSPPPQAQYDLGRCWERTSQKVFNIGQFRNCGLNPGTIDPDQQRVYQLLEAVAKKGQVPLIRLDRLLCGGGSCMTSIGGIPLYRDTIHFTDEGSLRLGRRFKLGERIWNEAR